MASRRRPSERCARTSQHRRAPICSYTCASANANDNTLCGFNGLFSYYGSVKPFTGTEQDTAISDKQNNVFSKNTYIGPIRFSAFNQSNNVSWAQWSRGFSYSGGGTFGAQDAGSTFASS